MRVAIRVALFVLTCGGCSQPPPPPVDTGTGPKGDPWVAAAARLGKDTSPVSTKAALAALTAEIGISDDKKLPVTSDEALTALAAVVPLTPADRDEIRGAAFSGHDPVYLADCFFLRDAARSLGVAGLPPEKQADVAFAWVCRQVYLNPWVRFVGAGYEPTALPPTVVLRRGFGSGLERMYVFLALLQQLELDGCLVGGPDAGGQTGRFNGPLLKYPTLPQLGVPRGPFWAVGVRVGTDVRLFDPWRGQPLPVTLGQLKANPDAAKTWFEAAENLSAATLEDAKKATAFLAVPVNALSARMAAFEARMKGELGVKVAYDLKALTGMRAAFPDPKPAFWNPPDDPFAYGRAARSFLPLDLGGSDPTPMSGGRIYEVSVIEQIPRTAFLVRAELKYENARDQFRRQAAGKLHFLFLEPPNPRERIARGQFQEAARDLVNKQEMFATGLERLRNPDTEKQINEWVEATNQIYSAVGLARLNNDKSAEVAAQAQAEEAWKQPGAQLLLDKSSAEVGRAEAAFLLGLCKHEQAERIQIRLDRATGAEAARLKNEARDAWRAALAAWNTYQQLAPSHAGFPGRAAHALALEARAAKFVEADTKK
ncbi:hypothetical protein FTUN_7813 [Frigoriglobus tundricola]|uniref:Uncharacterized protein n=1 Tax=Frigoriglobus tundricola TaxID=2774151 RepID=A0A6M5Z1X4_9BACT|nr:hypothetical protein FTUN_7813 [Frigoriglobus tundricola]